MSQATVLVVDDDSGIREALDRALRLEGFAVQLDRRWRSCPGLP